MSPIAFVHNIEMDEALVWLDYLRAALVDELIIFADDLSDEQIGQVEMVIVANPDPQALQKFKKLIWVQSLWAGVEKLVDGFRLLNAVRQQREMDEIKLVRLIDPQLAETMAEAVLAWTLYLHRQMPEYAAQQQQKIWKPLNCATAQNTRVSILGAGELGRCCVQTLLRQGYQVNSWSRSDSHVEGVMHYKGIEQLAGILQETDILVCLLPLTAQTKHLLNKQTLKQLPKGAKIINFARGGIVNHDDLQKLLDQGHLSHAVLDVFEQEPLVTDSPLWGHANITILPHISAMTNLETASKIAASNIINYRSSGVMPKHVDLERGY